MAKYPLEPLVRVRANEVDDAARALADAVAVRVAAETRLAESEAAEARFLVMAAEVTRKESLAFASGVLRAADLAQGCAFERGVSLEHQSLGEVVRAAAKTLADAQADEERARAKLADRKAHAKAVDRDREKFVAAERRLADAKEDEVAEEVHVNASLQRGGQRS